MNRLVDAGTRRDHILHGFFARKIIYIAKSSRYTGLVERRTVKRYSYVSWVISGTSCIQGGHLPCYLFCRSWHASLPTTVALQQVGEMLKDREGVIYGGMTGKGLKVCRD